MLPIKDFTTLSLSPLLLEVIKEIGYVKPTPIQAQSIPYLLEGRDLIGQSKTGSGKTAAFGIPILEKTDIENRVPQALILCPTRELCTQVAREIRRLGCRFNGLQVVSLTGGQPLRDQRISLEHGAQIIVGTPGRTLDHLKRGYLNISTVNIVVLDEADRMLDMGFEDEMNEILQKLPQKRQTLLFSATFPPTIEALSQGYQTNPVKIIIDDGSRSLAIEQQCYFTEYDQKSETLLGILRHNQPESVLIFCNLKATILEITKILEKFEISVASLHGDLEQRDRDRMMARFRNKSVRVLVATDVAARGLDIEDLDMVINYDVPIKPDIYVHRIGRTGRAGKKGLAIMLLTEREEFRFEDIEEFIGKKIERKSLSQLKQRDMRAKVLNKDAEMETLYISGGRKDKVRPGDILGALTGDAAHLDGKDIGKIEIHDRFSYVAVSKHIAQRAMEKLRDGRIKGHKFQIKMVR
ncbi:MAG: ATP-dependent RNA helicase DbpA [Oligoflexia bacterium]|nr:ATP-dependent RNA helicase DbpA [Oligoflexia bacterium]